MEKFFLIGKNKLFKLNRSITGNGLKKTLKIIKENFKDLKIKNIKSGSKVFDWKVPPEWNVTEAYVLDKNNNKIIDFKKNNLHLMGYSVPINKYIKKKELLKQLYFLKSKPSAIPYITSYYKKRWGFCVSYNFLKKIKIQYKEQDLFKIVIKSRFNANGYLNYGEMTLKGKTKDEILISTYICHPSMANNELSGPIVSMGLIEYFRTRELNKTLRFIFIPETIGSITYLSKNLPHLKQNVIGGFNLSCIGDDRNHSCMLSKYENSPSDDAIINAYKKLNIKKFKIFSFLKRGSDERQFNSPGIDLPISSIFRTKYGEFPEYHTSLDDFKLVTLRGIKGGFNVAKEAINQLQKKIIPRNLIFCEPNMGKRNLYPTLSNSEKKKETQNLMDFLQYADGKNTIEKISKKIDLNLGSTKKIYKKLKKYNLVR
jgi:aminopeptidase-like protein